MEVRATAKYVRVQPRKVRIIADEIRGKYAGHAAALLNHHTSKGAKSLRKVLISAMANAAENHGLAPETLKVTVIMVDEGPRLKRMIAKAMGRGARILKKTSHITVVVEDVEPEAVVKPHGAKAKPRPTFATKPAAKAKKADATVPPPVEEEPTTPEPTAPVEEPTEATPVDASEAPEEGGSAEGEKA
jgi:large subunit ribosomal protein L22